LAGECSLTKLPTGSLFCTGVKDCFVGLTICLGPVALPAALGALAVRYKGCLGGLAAEFDGGEIVSTTKASKAASCASLNGIRSAWGQRLSRPALSQELRIRTKTFK